METVKTITYIIGIALIISSVLVEPFEIQTRLQISGLILMVSSNS